MTSSLNQEDLRILKDLERQVLWHACWMIHHANHIREKGEIKVGGHQASSASMVSIMTALYFHELKPEDQIQLMREISLASKALHSLYRPEKINTAALGNMVPQLHIHVFARFTDDPAWPKPVWAVQQDEISYTETEKNSELQKLQECFKKLRTEDKITCQR